MEACARESRAKSRGLNVVSMLSVASEKQQRAEIEQNRRYMSALIKTVSFIVRQRWALDCVDDMIDHMQGIGTGDIATYLQVHPLLKYTSSQSVSEVVAAINSCIESDLLEKLGQADSFALLADESSDESHREQFGLLIRLKKDGKVGDYFLGLIEVKRTDAASLMVAIETFLLRKKIDIRRAVFVGFDGCNTMSGVNKGLQRRFRHFVPHQIYIHCRNHRLALCVKHLIKEFPIIDVVDGMLMGLWRLFHYSPRKFATLQEVQETYGLSRLRLIRACTTRWLSNGRACIRLVDRFVQVVDTLDACLEESYDADTHGVRQQLLNKNTMTTVLILCDILQPVVSFSDYLHGNVNFSDVMIRCRDLVQQLHHLIARFQAVLAKPNESLYLSRIQAVFTEIDDRTALSRRQHSEYTPRQVVYELAVPITYGLLNEITDAFHCSPVLGGFSVFNIQNVPERMQDMTTYGQYHIDTLARHYGNAIEDVFEGHRNISQPRFDEATYRAEFNNFKHQLCIVK